MTEIKVAAAQFSPVYLNIDETVAKTCDKIKEAASNGAKLVVFPEAFISGYPDWTWLIPNSKGSILNKLYSKLHSNSISVPSQQTDLLCETAKKNDIFVIIGINERNTERSDYSLYNSMVYINNNGEILGVHRKLIPTGGERLIWSLGDGKTLHSFQTPLGRIGGLICWENYIPLARISMYEQGTQIFAAPTWDKSDKWINAMKYIAMEGGMFVISSCQAFKRLDIPEDLEFRDLYPDDREWVNIGNSCIINPKGDIIAGPLKEQEGILYADIDLSEIASMKRRFDVAGHYSRPEIFEYKVRK